MAVVRISIEDFLDLVKDQPVIDVRSPGEYKHACIPGAYSLPLFDNDERSVVGTAYKQQSKQKAIKIGLDFFGKKMVRMVEEIEKITENKKETVEGKKTVFVHCWRGGMRSAGVAWLLDLYGFNVYTIVGGYKAFRKWVLQQFTEDYPFSILGGYTGSGKTEVLKAIKHSGEQIIDLEGLANHKGSAFGSIGMPEQPSQEMFENLFALQLWKMNSNKQADTIWLEDESQRIGNVNIPITLWNKIRTKPIYFLNIPFEERLEHIIKGYGKGDKEKLLTAIVRIKKRLGGLETKTAVNHLLEDDLKESFRVLLKYYDKWYTKGLQGRENWEKLTITIDCEKVDASANSKKILEIKKKI
jgi:tRNA 2-selenouridine synthase